MHFYYFKKLNATILTINTYALETDHGGVQPAQVVVDGHGEGTGGKLSPLTNSAEAKGSSD